MLAALFAACFPGPTITEIAGPKGWEAFSNLGLSRRGELVYEAYSPDENEDESRIYVWKDGKSARCKFVNDGGYQIEDMATHDAGVIGFLPDGGFFGYRVFAYNGASSTWANRPFVARNGEIKPLLLPKEFRLWNDLDPVARRPDGAFLLSGVEATKNSMMGEPKTWIDRLMWVKDGKLIVEVGKATNPFLDSEGRIVAATQFVDQDGDLLGGSINNRRAHVVLMRNGKFERVTDGEVIARLDNGDLVIKRSVFKNPDQFYDQPEKTTYHLLRGTQVLDWKIPGLPPQVQQLFIDPDGRGMVHGWDGDIEVLRAFNRTGYRDVSTPVNEIVLDNYINGWFSLSWYDADSAGARLFLGRL